MQWPESPRLWFSAIRQQTVNAEAKEREKNDTSETHLKAQHFGWIGGLGGTFTFIIECLGE
jgi:hypothetical protein